MKRLSLLIIIALLGTFAAKAQRPAQRPTHPQFNSKEMAAQIVIDLTKQILIIPAIQDSLNNTFITFFDEMKKGRESGSRPDMEKIEANTDLKAKKLLTVEQYKLYQKFMEERKNRKGRPGGDEMHQKSNMME